MSLLIPWCFSKLEMVIEQGILVEKSSKRHAHIMPVLMANWDSWLLAMQGLEAR